MPTDLLAGTENATTVLTRRWVIWGICVAVWTLALVTPQPAEIAQDVLPQQAHFPISKTLHVSAYAFLTALAAWLRVRGPKRWLLVAFLSLHGFLTEYIQNFVPLRTGTWRDVGLDHLGILLGLAVSWKWWRAGRLAPGADEATD
jgi:VanZ family protein